MAATRPPSTVSGPAPSTEFEAERATNFDAGAKRKRVAELVKNDPNVVDAVTYRASVEAAQAVVDGHDAEIQAYRDALATAKQELLEAQNGSVGSATEDDFASQEAKESAVAEKKAAVDAALAAKLVESNALAIATNEEWADDDQTNNPPPPPGE